MTLKENVPIAKYKAGSLPNFEKLTALLNQQKHPRRMLWAIVSLSKPLPESGDDCLQEPQVLV